MSHLFDRVYSAYSKVSDALTFNAATLSGAIDIIVVAHADGTFTSTPFHVRFGKLQLLKSREKLVTIRVNGRECDWKMKLGHAGEAFFLMDADRQQPATEEELQSPINSPVLAPAPAATLTTQHGTITPVFPAPHTGGRGDRPVQQPTAAAGAGTAVAEESKTMPELDVVAPPSPPPHASQHAHSRSSLPPGSRYLSSASASASGLRHARVVSSPVRAEAASRRLKEEEDERTIEDSDRPGTGNEEEEIDAEMLWTLQHESKHEIGNAVRLTRQCFSAPLSPHTPGSPRSPTSARATESPALTASTVPPSQPLQQAGFLNRDAPLTPRSPRSPLSPASADEDRTLSAPSASDAREHTYTWTWGHLPVHHQRFHATDTAGKTEQIVHPPSTAVAASPSIPAAAAPPVAASPLPAPALSAPGVGSNSSLPSSLSVEAKSDVVKELQLEAAAAAASLANPNDAVPAPTDGRSWSVRGIFSTVFSKLPARASFSLPYGGSADSSTPPAAAADEKEEPAMEAAAAPPPPPPPSPPPPAPLPSNPAQPATVVSGFVSSPRGAINLDEAHLPLPWLQRVEQSPGKSQQAAAVAAPALPPAVSSSPALAAQSTLQPSSLPSPSFTSPLSAPLPASSSSSSSGSVSSAVSSANPSFALPSQARPLPVLEGSLLQLSRETKQPEPPAETSAAATSSRSSFSSSSPIPLPQHLSIDISDAAEAKSPSTAPTSAATAVSPSSSTSSSASSFSSSAPSPLPAQPDSAPVIRLSLCGQHLGGSSSVNQQLFELHAVSHAQLTAQPELAFHPQLVVLYQERLYPARVALPLLLSQLAFGKPLPLDSAAIERLAALPLPLPAADADRAADGRDAGSAGKERTDAVSAASSPEAGGRSWRNWWSRSRKPPPIETVPVPSDLSLQQSRAQQALSADETGRLPPSLTQSRSLEPLPVGHRDDAAAEEQPPPTISVTAPPEAEPPLAKAASLPTASSSSASPASPPFSPLSSSSSSAAVSARPTFIKSLRPTSSMLKSLGLQPGRNQATFSVTSALQGEQTVPASIYLWRPDVKIVISDIDGTITRSDLLGHVMPLVGRDWSHTGVTKLYSDIHRNGYELLYLTSRAIGQAGITRGYIQTLRQGQSTLPFGPVIMSPDRLLHSFKREVIDRRPQEFKIVALRDVKHLFDDEYCPFFAGFGNRITDVVAYRAVGVPPTRIYIINPHGSIQHVNSHFNKSYPELGSLVHAMFPALLDGRKGDSEFNDFQHWRLPIARLSEDDNTDSDTDTETDSDTEPRRQQQLLTTAGLAEGQKRELQREEKELSKDKVLGTIT